MIIYETFCIYSIAWFSAPYLDKMAPCYVHLSIMLNIWRVKELKFFREFPKYNRAFYCFFQQRDFV